MTRNDNRRSTSLLDICKILIKCFQNLKSQQSTPLLWEMCALSDPHFPQGWVAAHRRWSWSPRVQVPGCPHAGRVRAGGSSLGCPWWGHAARPRQSPWAMGLQLEKSPHSSPALLSSSPAHYKSLCFTCIPVSWLLSFFFSQKSPGYSPVRV